MQGSKEMLLETTLQFSYHVTENANATCKNQSVSHLYSTSISNLINLHPYKYSILHIKPVQKADDFLGAYMNF